jgi:hypothetical protein
MAQATAITERKVPRKITITNGCIHFETPSSLSTSATISTTTTNNNMSLPTALLIQRQQLENEKKIQELQDYQCALELHKQELLSQSSSTSTSLEQQLQQERQKNEELQKHVKQLEQNQYGVPMSRKEALGQLPIYRPQVVTTRPPLGHMIAQVNPFTRAPLFNFPSQIVTIPRCRICGRCIYPEYENCGYCH